MMNPKRRKPELETSGKPPIDDAADIKSLGFPTMTTNALTREGIVTVGQLRKLTDLELIRIQGLGRTSLKRVRDRLGNPGEPGSSASDDARMERMIRRVVREEFRSLFVNLMRNT